MSVVTGSSLGHEATGAVLSNPTMPDTGRPTPQVFLFDRSFRLDHLHHQQSRIPFPTSVSIVRHFHRRSNHLLTNQAAQAEERWINGRNAIRNGPLRALFVLQYSYLHAAAKTRIMSIRLFDGRKAIIYSKCVDVDLVMSSREELLRALNMRGH